MILNTQINYQALEENFELSPFAGLRRLDTPPRQPEHDSNIRYLSAYCDNKMYAHV